MLLVPYSDLINLEWPIGTDAEDKRGCQGVQIIIGKPVNGHLGAQQTRPIANSAPNQLGPYCHNLGELYQRRYTCTYLRVAERVLKIYRSSSVKFKDYNCVLLSNIL